ncbi:MAG: FtsX-like permease family protein, partial [Ginsengibacter sp.]
MDRKIISTKELRLHNKGYNFLWLMRMAWRDSRKSRSRLFLFISSIILGIAALVAIYSLGNNLSDEVDSQAASLLGADLEISGSNPTNAAIQKIVDTIGKNRSAQQSFASMVLFTKNDGTRLTEVRALQGGYPYYGSLETSPVSAAQTFRNNQQALVDETLMLQYDAKIGDSIKVGDVTFSIAGKLLNAPGQTGLSASIAPIVYIPLQYMKQTALAKKGSRISYRYYFKFNRNADVEQLVQNLKPGLEANDLRYETVESQKEDTGRSFENLTRFLSLVGFIALLLGCTGVASAVHVYIKEKVNSIAILRCLGVKASQAFIIFLIQIVGIGLIGSLIGTALGVFIQQFLPYVIKDFLPVKVSTPVSWSAVGQGMALGVIIAVLFALLPLLSIRKISPLNALRVSYEPPIRQRDPVKWLVYLLVILFVYGFTFIQMDDAIKALYFTESIAAALLVLAGIARALMWLVRHFFPSSWNYLWRQGLANLYRPNNQTTVLIISIGLGTALICTLLFVQSVLINRITLSTSANQPNIVLFDIQTKQEDSVAALARQFGLPVKERVPIVNMRLETINGITAAQARKDSTLNLSRWLFSREYRVTYRDSLTESEKITDGRWPPKPNGSGLPEVSLEKNFANRSGVKMGDTLTFNVQGSLMPTVVGSLREVNWGGIQTNFLVLFPTGLLEDAPQFHVLLTRVPSQQVSANFQQAMVKAYPNVSIIDLGLVLRVLDDLLGKIGFVIRFMAGFSIVTGLVVLVSSVLISKYQRLQESVLLRTLGGSRKQIFTITALEYFFLGALAALTGILLALAASWALARYMFETPFQPALMPVIILFGLVCMLTVVIGLANSRGILNRSP